MLAGVVIMLAVIYGLMGSPLTSRVSLGQGERTRSEHASVSATGFHVHATMRTKPDKKIDKADHDTA
ncbi:MAG: hypothetical protein JWO67_6666 [Streptosporangiaceae bacterium]|jgi:hypothetical protein|nr:hypothetical protein [Streptosporangiaceae bacterium]